MERRYNGESAVTPIRRGAILVSPASGTGCSSAHIGAPRPTWSRVTTAGGRSPGLRVFALGRLPRTRVPSGNLMEDSPLTVAGAASDSDAQTPLPNSRFVPFAGTATVDRRGRRLGASMILGQFQRACCPHGTAFRDFVGIRTIHDRVRAGRGLLVGEILSASLDFHGPRLA
jgi:hypothetical protein